MVDEHITMSESGFQLIYYFTATDISKPEPLSVIAEIKQRFTKQFKIFRLKRLHVMLLDRHILPLLRRPNGC